MKRLLLFGLLVLPALAQAQAIGELRTGPRILGEPSFAFELDALDQSETPRPGWPVTTTRPSSCMALDGTSWKTQAANVACVGRWGMESFGAFTNHWPNSAMPEQWPEFNGGLVASGNSLTDSSTSSEGAARSLTLSLVAGESTTVSCILQAGTTDRAKIWAGVGSSCQLTLTSTPTRYSCTGLAAAPVSAKASLVVGHVAVDTGSIIASQCQFTKTPAPMPRHDAGAAAATRNEDDHSAPTTGWPVASGEVRLQYTPLNAHDGTSTYFLLSAESFSTVGWGIYVRNTRALTFIAHGGGSNQVYASGALAWIGCDPTSTSCVPYDIRVVWGPGGVQMYRDAVQVFSSSSTPLLPAGPLPAVAFIGSRAPSGDIHAQGSIRLLRVSP